MASRTADIPATPPTNRVEGTRAAAGRRYFPCFEGLRAISATAVLAHHAITLAGEDSVGRFYGAVLTLDVSVPIFFVISGFLIYRPFVAAAAEGRSPGPVLRFWWRRLLRIVPAYWLALSLLALFGWVELGAQPWRYYLFVQNYDAYTTFGGIVPAWTLNTEMVFYLFVPGWALFMRRVVAKGRTTTMNLELGGLAALILSAYVFRWGLSQTDRVWGVSGEGEPVLMRAVTFTWLPTTIDIFAMGMLLAVLSVWAGRDARLQARLERLGQAAWTWWLAAFAVWLAFTQALGAPDLNGGYQDGYWQVRQAAWCIVPLFMIVPAVFGDQDRGLIRRGLRLRPVAWVGTVSLGLYVWHIDILQQIPIWLDRPPSEIPLVVLVGGTMTLGLVAAAFSWYLVEKPLQSLRREKTVPVLAHEATEAEERDQPPTPAGV